MNVATYVFLFLALISTLIPSPTVKPRHSICVKAFIGDRMFNQFLPFEEVPRQGDFIGVGDYSQRVQYVKWKSSSPLVFLEDEDTTEAEQRLIAAGFVEFKKQD